MCLSRHSLSDIQTLLTGALIIASSQGQYNSVEFLLHYGAKDLASKHSPNSYIEEMTLIRPFLLIQRSQKRCNREIEI